MGIARAVGAFALPTALERPKTSKAVYKRFSTARKKNKYFSVYITNSRSLSFRATLCGQLIFRPEPRASQRLTPASYDNESNTEGTNPPNMQFNDEEIENRKQKVSSMFADMKASAFSDTEDITVTELKRLQECPQARPLILVDVRTKEECTVSVIPGAITKEDFEKLDPASYKDTTVVVYCTIGYRSGKYVQKLQKSNVKALNLKGSILDWSLSGYPLVEPGDSAPFQPTTRVHVYAKPWDLVGRGYQAIWYNKPLFFQVAIDFIKQMVSG